jgi:hypothetical protein
MDIQPQAEVILRKAGYRTRTLDSSGTPTLSFEDDSIIGFLKVFQTVAEMSSSWQDAERSLLSRYAVQFRAAPAKSWNIYCVFLVEQPAIGEDIYSIDRIEEDFSSTRKIARAGVSSISELQRALLPLLPLQVVTTAFSPDSGATLRSRLSILPRPVVDAVVTGQGPEEILRIVRQELQEP